MAGRSTQSLAIILDTWSPISRVDLDALIAQQLQECPLELRTVFEKHRVEPFRAPLDRNGRLESVFVVARRGAEVMYYEDVEEGFNFSPISAEGKVLEHWCNQDELKSAIRKWK